MKIAKTHKGCSLGVEHLRRPHFFCPYADDADDPNDFKVLKEKNHRTKSSSGDSFSNDAGFAYLRPSFASMHSVACGTRMSRAFGISLPVVLQMP